MSPGLLDGVRFFRRLSSDERARVVGLLRPVTFAPGERLIQPDVRPAGLYVIERGRVDLQIHVSGDSRFKAMPIGAGDVLGEWALVMPHAFPITAAALEPTQAWLLEARMVEGLRLLGDPLAFGLMHAMARVVCARVRFLTAEIVGAPDPDRASETAETALAPGLTAPVGPADLSLMALLPLFRGLAPATFASEAALFERFELARGARLYAEGDASDRLYVVLRGAIELTAQRKGKRRRLTIAGPGRLMGELGFFGAHPHHADASAKENAIVLSLSRARFEALVTERRPLALRLFEAAALSTDAVLQGTGRRHAEVLVARRLEPV